MRQGGVAHFAGEIAEAHLVVIGSDGRRLRQVELAEGGDAVKSDPDDWPFNPPIVDLFDPELKELEVSRDEFEAAWQRARAENP